MKIFFSFLLVSLILIAPVAHGAENYTLLESIAGFDAAQPAPSLSAYLQGIFVWIVRVAAILAVISLIYAGIQYTATSLNESLKGRAKARIQNVAFGLLGVIGAYFLLQLINPALVKFDLNIPAINVGGTAPIIPNSGPSQQPRMTAKNGVIVASECRECHNLSVAGVPVKAGIKGDSANAATVSKLARMNVDLQNQGVEWLVTEAWPPEVEHRDNCHAIGTCVDADITGESVSDLNIFMSAAKSVGLRPVYEVASEGAVTALINKGFKGKRGVDIKAIPPKADGTPGITGTHFSVYND